VCAKKFQKICSHDRRESHGRDAQKLLQNTHKKLHRADLSVLSWLLSITRAPALNDAKTGEDKKKRDSNKNIFVRRLLHYLQQTARLAELFGLTSIFLPIHPATAPSQGGLLFFAIVFFTVSDARKRSTTPRPPAHLR